MITDAEKAYMAGLVDGEGCIYVDRWKDVRNKTGNYSYILRFQLGMTCEKTIKWLYSTISKEFKCNSYLCVGKEFTETNRKPMYNFKLSKYVYEFLRYIYPYLITKKNQAELAFEWEATRFENNTQGRDGRFQKIPIDLLEKKEEIYKKFKVLNKTGR